MIRYLKVLGLALVAVCALSAMVASAASAQGKLTSDGPVTIDGTDELDLGAGVNFFEYPTLGKVECKTSHYTGHTMLTHKQTEEGKKHELLPSGSTNFTVVPTYTNPCEVSGFFKATITMNGCDFDFTLGATTGVDEYAVTADVTCPTGKVIEVHVYSDTTSEAVPSCTVTVPAQNGITGLQVKNEVDATGKTLDTLTITGESANITAMKHGLCGAGETKVAKYRATVTLTGTNSAGGATGITVTD